MAFVMGPGVTRSARLAPLAPLGIRAGHWRAGQEARMPHPTVGIIMGSQSDWATMREAAQILDELAIPYEAKIVSAHRTPDRLWTYGKTAVDRGLKVIIAGAGGAAHLPGMMASKTRLPVIGVPVLTKALSGVDSLYSIVQMPKGFPVATMAIGAAGAANAGLMAAGILAISDPALAARLDAWREALSASIPEEPKDD
jgi:5-(carboxyamino)imidazole ribonucleotide mutase